MKPNSLRLVLVSVVVLLQLISLALVGYLTNQQLGRQQQQRATASLSAQADEVVEKTRLFLVPALSQLTSASQLIADGLLDSRQDQHLATFFRSQLRSNTWLKGITLTRPDGSLVRVGRFRDGNQQRPRPENDLLITKIIRLEDENRQALFEELDETTGEVIRWQESANQIDPRQSTGYRNAIASQGVVWSNAFSYYANSEPVVSASRPIGTADSLDAGVLSIAVNLHELTRFIDRNSDGRIESAVLIDANGQIIAHAHSRPPPPGTRRGHGPRPLLMAPDQALVELYSRSREIASDDDRDTLIEELDIDDSKRMGLARSVKLFNGGIQWTLLITSSLHTHPDESDQLLGSAMRFALLIIAAPGILALVLIIAVTAPVYRLYRRATVDHLTRAFNREEFGNRLDARLTALTSQRSDEHQWLLAVMDLDGFKSINDAFGHPTGDLVLRAVVKRLQRNTPSGSVIGRLGGDEFALLYPAAPAEDPVMLLEALRRKITSQAVPSRNGSHRFGLTIGVSPLNRNDNVDAVLQRADLALVRGKLLGKNQTYLARESEEDVATNPAEVQARTEDCAAA